MNNNHGGSAILWSAIVLGMFALLVLGGNL